MGSHVGRYPGVWRVSDRGGTPELIVRAEPGQNIVMPVDAARRRPRAVYRQRRRALGSSGRRVQSLQAGERRVLVKVAVHGRYLSSGHLVDGKDGALQAVKFDRGDCRSSEKPCP